MYNVGRWSTCAIRVEFMPMSSTCSASVINSFSHATAVDTISSTRSPGSLWSSMEYTKHAKSQCSPSSRLISSLEKHMPGSWRGQHTTQTIQQRHLNKPVVRDHALDKPR